MLAKTLSRRELILVSGLSGFACIFYFLLTTMDTGAAFWTVPLTMTGFIYEYGQSVSVNVLGLTGDMIVFVASWLILMAGLIRGIVKRRVEIPITLIVWAGPLAILIVVSLVFYKNVITYRTLQPAAMGLALAAGRALAMDVRWRWTWVPAGLLLVALLLNWDPSTRGGDLRAIADHIRTEWRDGDCIEYSDFGRPLELLLDDLAECGDVADGRRWIVASFDYAQDEAQGELVDTTRNAWQIAPVKVYLLEK
jgi:hypothetical protein